VDKASYTLARNMLRAGKLPDPRTVRVEEFVNYFPEEAPADPDHAFSVFSEGGPSPFGQGLELLKISVKARSLKPGERKDAVLTFVVDASGSMATRASGNEESAVSRLRLVRLALSTLLSSLGADDRVAVVAYSTQAYLVLPHTRAVEKERILGAVNSLEPRGATNVEAGLDLAYRVADEVFEPKAVNRVILCSDGVANVGARGPQEILKKVEVFARRGIYLSSVGFGMGRYNDSMLETLANKGNGNYAYVDSLAEAQKVFRENLPSTLQVLAQDAKIQVDFNPEVVSHYRLLGYENRDIADKDFRNDKVDAGEVGPGSTVTVLCEIRRKTNPSGDIGRIYLRYKDVGTARVEEVSYPLSPGVMVTSLREASERFRFMACVAEFAELLKQSYWSRDGSFGKVLGVLGSLGPEGRAREDSKEVADLVVRAQALTIQNLASGAVPEGKKR
jgi:Ca-activated chloride channel family protein